MPSDLIQTVREALAKATPGPWVQGDGSSASYHEGGYVILCPKVDGRRVLARMNSYMPWEADARLIANAPQWLAELVARVEALEEAVRWMSGSNDFAPGGTARVGYERIVLPLLEAQPAASEQGQGE